MIYNTAEGQRLESGEAALAYLEASVDELDRRFDSRAFDGTPEITGEDDTVTMLFKVRYTLDGAPDLVLSGEEIAVFRDGRIQQMDDIFDEAAVDGFASWMEQYGSRLSAP